VKIGWKLTNLLQIWWGILHKDFCANIHRRRHTQRQEAFEQALRNKQITMKKGPISWKAQQIKDALGIDENKLQLVAATATDILDVSNEVSGKKLTEIIDVIYSSLYDATTVEPAATPVTVAPIVEPAERMKMDANFTNRREVIELSVKDTPQKENERNDVCVDRVCDHRGLWVTFFGSLVSDESCSFLEHQKKLKCHAGGKA
jgi:hypothetical protein